MFSDTSGRALLGGAAGRFVSSLGLLSLLL